MLRLSGESNPGPPALQANTLCKEPFERRIELPCGISPCAATVPGIAHVVPDMAQVFQI
jgi:hypothetical protein